MNGRCIHYLRYSYECVGNHFRPQNNHAYISLLYLHYKYYIIPILFDKFHRTFCLFEVYSYKIRILFSLEPHIFLHPFTINNIIASRAVGSYISHIWQPVVLGSFDRFDYFFSASIGISTHDLHSIGIPDRGIINLIADKFNIAAFPRPGGVWPPKIIEK